APHRSAAAARRRATARLPSPARAPGAGRPARAARACGGGARAPPAERRRRSDRRSPAASLELSLQEVGEMAKAGARARLDGAERNVQVGGPSALREPAVVRELDDLAFVRIEAFERAVHPPSGVGRFCTLGGRRIVGRKLGPLAGRLATTAAA